MNDAQRELLADVVENYRMNLDHYDEQVQRLEVQLADAKAKRDKYSLAIRALSEGLTDDSTRTN